MAAAGGGPLNTLVVVNDNSPDSIDLGRYYAERRGIPDRNIFHITVTTNYNVDTVAFTNSIRAPIINYIASAGLSNQVDYIVFSRDIPYRVFLGALGNKRHGGLTAAMFYDFKSSPDAFASGCTNENGSAQDYFLAERSFTHAGAPSSNRYYLSAMLNSFDMDGALRLVDRASSADGTMPTSSVYFLNSTDYDRNAQWPEYENADFLARFLTINQQRFIYESNMLVGVANVMGYNIGATYALGLNQVGFAKGAYGDHFTSFGGFLLDPTGQMSILEWISYGAAGSYGTVVEPCGFTNKFTNPRLHYWYGRGFSLGEAHWMSVQNPYQGVFVGDPLCAPYAQAPVVTWGGWTNGALLSGAIAISATALTAAAAGRCDQLDLFLDGVKLATMTNELPAAGNIVEAIVGDATGRYTVASGDTLFRVAAGLATAVNASASFVFAQAFGDRIQIVSTNLGFSESDLAYSVTTSTGTAGVLSVTGRTAGSNFLDSVCPAREFLALRGTAGTGDLVRCVITLTNGVVATNSVIAAGGETASTVMTQLIALINADATLQGADGVAAKHYDQKSSVDAECALDARAPGPQGYDLFVDFRVTRAFPASGFITNDSFSDRFNDNADVLRARGTIFLSAGQEILAASRALDTTNLPDGPHELQVVAYEGSAIKTQGRASAPFIVDNNSITCAVVSPLSGQNFSRGVAITTQVAAATSIGSITQVQFFAEGKLLSRTGAPPYVFIVSTTNVGSGSLALQARADDNGGRSALSEIETIVIFSDRDGDGLSDQWEYAQFGGLTNATPGADSDGDQVSNAAEYIADTEPTNGNSYFRIVGYDGFPEVIQFSSRTTRTYRVDYLEGSLTNISSWSPADTNLIEGSEGVTAWTNANPSTNSVRLYRVNVRRP